MLVAVSSGFFQKLRLLIYIAFVTIFFLALKRSVGAGFRAVDKKQKIDTFG